MASIVSAGTTSATALNMSADTSGVLQLASNNGTVAVTVDTSQNVGLGVTPSAWGSSGNGVVEFVRGGNINSAGGSTLYMGNNFYYNGTNYIYKTSQGAAQFGVGQGTFSWSIAAAGTAGNAITFTQAMTLNSNGNLGVIGAFVNGGPVYTGSFFFTSGSSNILTLAVGEAYMFYSVYTNYGGSDNRHGVYYIAARNSSTASGTTIANLGASGTFSITSAGVVSYTAGGGTPSTTIYWQKLS